jgi:hypothetical protein
MRIAGTLPIAMLLAVASPASLFAAEPLLFQFEQQAQRHCPDDSVVWTDAARHLYNVKGERWYGATKSGAYVCLRDVEKAGYHARPPAASTARLPAVPIAAE